MVIVIAGPTASGKSSIAMSIAERIRGVIINADSRQLYKGLPILTAHPSKEDMDKVPHKLYGVFEYDEQEVSSASWSILAEKTISEISSKDPSCVFILVGGTGFYIDAFINGLSPIPTINPDIKRAFYEKHINTSTDCIRASLREIDPDSEASIQSSDRQRLLRALLVSSFTDRAMSSWQSLPRSIQKIEFFNILVLPDRETLKRKITARLNQMIRLGVIDEVAEFRSLENYRSSQLALSIGFKEFSLYIDGAISLERSTELTEISTRRYAKRQSTWFRNKFSPDLVIYKESSENLEYTVDSIFNKMKKSMKI
ncbi:tRNA (adenosine(37)-N6)-dimethylallyltransferase MiaA [Candidatus Hydrogenosomobacter endosymbioticus]|uniref:tRNA dimethylallyltransferase n=1 Tax=Candidatus Hydrogenosomobacter endosymbioticus TaxID=2558174 RepID=A0ABN6L290_9PROT|nr:tRNA (adenosine(37)-N6)-dimethylallyltransferase MiaA [Candidatus Hydrogenosomobacter endosymbioticus]BDB95962.1 tRNA dimethylallyltransferase [Candidatus Hydrogenosomobacter endosymbioticus]